MRYLVGLTMLVLFAANATVASAIVRGKEKTKAVQSEEKTNQIICDLTHPWPFHDCSHGDETPARPAAPARQAADSDGDGVNDDMDRCPGTPRGAKVDAKGCPLDSDGDGVFDGLDRCGDTPKGARVDSRGCPSDSDGDGVYDGLDRCAGTPKGVDVDAKGCPVMTDKERAFLDTGVFTTSDIVFDSGKATLKSASYPIIDSVGRTLVKWPRLKVEIAGHTDSQGREGFNQDLSEKRAQAVREYLLKNYSSIRSDALVARGYGESTPVASNDTAEGRGQNRRVEFRILNLDEVR